jgi:hypothetical protein
MLNGFLMANKDVSNFCLALSSIFEVFVKTRPVCPSEIRKECIDISVCDAGGVESQAYIGYCGQQYDSAYAEKNGFYFLHND